MDKNKYSSDMKEEVIEVLEQFNYGNHSINQAANELLDLFSVRLSLLAEKAADEATERYEHIQGVDYGNGLEHGFESGAEWIVEEIKRNEA